MDPAQVATVATSVVIVAGGLIAWFRWLRPHLHRAQRFLGRIDLTINGSPAEYDAYGHEKSPAIPPLAEQQVATQQALIHLTETVAAMNIDRKRISALEQRVDEHAREITDLKAARMERVMTKAEAIAAWRAMEAANGGTPPETEIPEENQ